MILSSYSKGCIGQAWDILEEKLVFDILLEICGIIHRA